MKKILLFLLAGIMVFSVVACSSDNQSKDTPNITGSLEEIMEQIYGGVEADLSFPKDITEITSENAEYFLGVTDIEFVEAIASEPMMSSIAHSVVLLRTKEGADIEGIKTKIKENVDGYKWICVGVEKENIIVDNIGDLVILIMDENSKELHDSFLALSK